MIRDFTEDMLAEVTDDDLAEAIREHGHEASDEAMNAIVGIIRLPVAVRGEVVSYFRNTHIICNECGATSCIHGYPDY